MQPDGFGAGRRRRQVDRARHQTEAQETLPAGPRHDEPPRITLGYSTAPGGGHPPPISRLLHRSVAAGVLESISDFGYLRRAEWRDSNVGRTESRRTTKSRHRRQKTLG